MTTAAPSEGFLHIVVGYDGSPPATRALDAAVRLLQGRAGRIEVVWVSHLSSTVMLSADAIAEMETGWEELEPELRDQAAGQLHGLDVDWGFQRLQGSISDELVAMAAGLQEAHPGQTVLIVVGSSSHAGLAALGAAPLASARARRRLIRRGGSPAWRPGTAAAGRRPGGRRGSRRSPPGR